MHLQSLLSSLPKHHELEVKVGGTLYICARDTHVLDGIEAICHTVAILQPGDWVTWNGPVRDLWQSVTTSPGPDGGGKTGYLLMSSLTPYRMKNLRLPDEVGPAPCRYCNGYGFYVTSRGVGSIAHIIKCSKCKEPSNARAIPTDEGYNGVTSGQATKA